MASLYTVEEETKIGCFFFLLATSAFFWTMLILLFRMTSSKKIYHVYILLNQYEYFLNLLQHLDLGQMENSI
jgi:5-hydroxyisourate hydrolase-like protein (transthyretin family)